LRVLKEGSMRGAVCAATVATLLTLSGCSWFDGMFDKKKDPPLPGERVSVLQVERKPPVASGAAAPVQLPRPEVNADWPQAGGYPNHDMQHPALAEAPKKVWQVSIGDGSSDGQHIMSMPVVADGRIYAIDASGEVSCLDAATGKTIWSVDSKPEDADAPVVSGGVSFAEGKLFVATGLAQVMALDPASGKQIWVQSQSAPIHSAPTVLDGRVFVVTVDNELVALSAADGHKLWSQTGITNPAGLMGGASPAAEAGIVIAPYSSGEIYALRVETGRTAWEDNLTAVRRVDAVSALSDIRGRPVIDRGTVYAASHSGRLVAIDMKTGERLWDREIASEQQPWIAGDFLYVLTTEAELYCLSRADGLVRWSTPLQRFGDPENKKDPIRWAGPVLSGDRLVVASSEGQAVSISPYSGEILGKMDLGAKTLLPPVVANQTLYFLTDDGNLIAYR
jgi:outer membrane protein assembly factor BamB